MLTFVQLFPIQQLSASASLLYTSPSGTQTRIDKLTATNITGSAATVTVHIVPSGAGSSSANTITSAFSVSGGATFNDPDVVGQVLNPGDSIQITAGTASAINVMASGVQQT